MYIEETPVFSLSSYMAPKLPPQVATQRKILEILSQSFSSLCRKYNIACTSWWFRKKARAKNGSVGIGKYCDRSTGTKLLRR
jgi:hypothetical protein